MEGITMAEEYNYDFDAKIDMMLGTDSSDDALEIEADTE
jgi:hypothetical protein